MKKDIYITITSENKKFLNELNRFVSNWDYPQEEKHKYQDDLGKIETKSCVFRFIKHINVINVQPEKKRFFLSHPDEKDLVEISLDKFTKDMMDLISERDAELIKKENNGQEEEFH